MSGARYSVQRFRRAGRLELLNDVMSYLANIDWLGDVNKPCEAFLGRYESLKVRPGSTPVNPLNKEQRAALKLMLDCLDIPEEFVGKYADAYELMKDLV